MSRVAVIGGGISGHGAAWLLARQHGVMRLERETRLGGHMHSHDPDPPDGPLAVDTGFMVHNDRTDPLPSPVAMAGAAHAPVRGRREASARGSG